MSGRAQRASTRATAATPKAVPRAAPKAAPKAKPEKTVAIKQTKSAAPPAKKLSGNASAAAAKPAVPVAAAPAVPAATVESHRAASKSRKRPLMEPETEEETDLFPVDAAADSASDADTSDSEESVFSGLEEEEEDESASDDEVDDDDDEGSDGSEEDAAEKGDDASEASAESEENAPLTGSATTKREIMKKYGEIDTDSDSDSSADEHSRNPIGNVPLEWYNEYPHIGYDIDGKKIMRPAKGDELDTFLKKMDDPDYWRTVEDKLTGLDVVLNDDDLELISRLQQGQFPEGHYNPYEDSVDFFTHEKMIHPLSDAPEPKRRFTPSKWEHKRIMKIVRAIKAGLIGPKTIIQKPEFYPLWDDDTDRARADHPMHMPAPKVRLPGHDESYNPPAEYLPTKEEAEAWKTAHPDDRDKNYLPTKYSSLRSVPAYNRFVQERFERCLDLYLCPRMKKARMHVDPESLIPKLPKAEDLRPFPTRLVVTYVGHTGKVQCVSPDPTGQWLATGADDGTVRYWEVATGRCLGTLELGGVAHSVAWNPNPSASIVAVAVGNRVLLTNPPSNQRETAAAIDVLIRGTGVAASSDADSKAPPASWDTPTEKESARGVRLVLTHNKEVRQITWHHKGDYLATVQPDATSTAVLIHQMSKRRTQAPFKKSKGLVQRVLFHPTKPFFFVATQRYVRVYNLAKQELTKKLLAGVKWISSLDVHPGGDNVIIGSYDKRLCWFDMDLSSTPYKTLRYHKLALRQVCFHKRYPLFASCSDDGNIHVFHGMVYADLLQNPLIVPVKILTGHVTVDSLGVLDCQFHPTQPWLFSAGADSTVRLFS